jgi:putative transcriptional regulator
MTSLAPALLLSMPQLVDDNFRKAVVLLCKHTDEGAFGLIVNRPLVTTGRVVVSVDPLMSTEQELQVWLGGPVETERSCMLVGGNPDEDSFTGMRIGEGLHLSTSPDLLRRLLEPNPPPSARLMVGYSAWGPGQLESELQESAWLISDVDRELIFDVEPERMWEKAMRRIGADPAGLHTWRVH